MGLRHVGGMSGKNTRGGGGAHAGQVGQQRFGETKAINTVTTHKADTGGRSNLSASPLVTRAQPSYPPYKTYPLPWPELDHNSPPNGGARDASSRTWTPRP